MLLRPPREKLLRLSVRKKTIMVQALERNKGTLFVISACSGTGKTSLVKGVLAQLKEECRMERVVTYTTRSLRSGEIDGHDYHFMSPLEFERRIEEGFFLEWSQAYGAYYGSPKQELLKLDQGISLILILDQVGFSKVLSLDIGKEMVSIWIAAPSIAVLEQRLLNRRSENDTQLAVRLTLAKREVENVALLALFRYKLVNEEEQMALKNLVEIIKTEILRDDFQLGQPSVEDDLSP